MENTMGEKDCLQLHKIAHRKWKHEVTLQDMKDPYHGVCFQLTSIKK